jgi:hypothetical protein
MESSSPLGRILAAVVVYLTLNRSAELAQLRKLGRLITSKPRLRRHYARQVFGR